MGMEILEKYERTISNFDFTERALEEINVLLDEIEVLMKTTPLLNNYYKKILFCDILETEIKSIKDLRTEKKDLIYLEMSLQEEILELENNLFELTKQNIRLKKKIKRS